MEEKTSFRLVFGDSPVAKVLDFFMDNREFDYSLTDIAKGADIAWSTLHLIWPDLMKLNVFKHTRKIGRAELYKLDVKNPVVKKLLEIDMLVSKELIQKEVGKKLVVAE